VPPALDAARSAQSHLEQARRLAHLAELYAQRLNEPGFRDWEIVACFYASLHKLEAYFAFKPPENYDVARHDDRWRAIKDSPELTKAYFHYDYRELKNLSESVRYTAGFIAPDEDIERARYLLNRIGSVLDGKIARHMSTSPAPRCK
jgi:hypothetical protein